MIQDFATEATIDAPGTTINALKIGTIIDLNPNFGTAASTASVASGSYRAAGRSVEQLAGLAMPSFGVVQFEITTAFTSAGNPTTQFVVILATDASGGNGVMVGASGSALDTDFSTYAYYTYIGGAGTALASVGTLIHVPFCCFDQAQDATRDPKVFRYLLAGIMNLNATVGYSAGQAKARFVGATTRLPSTEQGTYPSGMTVQ